MQPNYITQYLEFIGAHTTAECIAVPSSDNSGIFVFQRFFHDTQVLAGTAADLFPLNEEQNVSDN
jgi:hypothetical protein